MRPRPGQNGAHSRDGVPAVFVDRDGTVIHDRAYLDNVEGVELLPGAAQALSALSEAGFLLVLATNQSGIGREFFTAETVVRQHRRLSQLLAPYGVAFADIQICPHTPADRCSCRKPEPGMLLRASRKLGVELSRSFMVGDKISDVEAGRRAGCRTVLLDRTCDGEADARAADLLAAAQWVIAGGWSQP